MERLNFETLVDKLVRLQTDHLQKADTLTIVGGTCPVDQVETFISGWQLRERQLGYGIWETVSQMTITDSKKILTECLQQINRLERCRFFGEANDGTQGGDLTLRRAGPKFRWWFIGPAGVDIPAGYDRLVNFWKEEPSVRLLRHDERALLWGKYDDVVGRWYDDRVARAKLTYPGLDHTAERVQVNYWSFTDQGQVAFTWLRGLEAYDA